jgi:hypothetical protein
VTKTFGTSLLMFLPSNRRSGAGHRRPAQHRPTDPRRRWAARLILVEDEFEGAVLTGVAYRPTSGS